MRAQQDPRAAAASLNDLGAKAFQAGRYDQAARYFQDSLELFQRLQDARGVRTALMNLGLVSRTLGQDKKSLDYYERALSLTDESDLPALSNILSSLGTLAAKTGQLGSALQYFSESAKIEEARGDRRGYAAAMDGLGQVFSRQRQFDRALEVQLRALEVIRATGDLREISRVLGNLGVTGKAKGDYDLATRYLTQALELERQFASRDTLAGRLTNLALIYFDQNKLEPAAAAFAEAILHHEAISREVRDASKVGDYQDWFRASLYRRYAHVLVNQSKPGEALAILERGRAQGLARQAAQNRADYARVLGGIDARRLQTALAAFNAASEALRQVDGLEALADEGPATGLKQQVLAIRRRYEEADRQLTALRADLANRYPAYRRMSGATPPQPADFEELAEKNPDTLYLQWAVGAEKTSLLFAVSQKDGIQSFVLGVGEEAIHRQAASWRSAIEKEQAGPEAAAAKALYTSLFSAVEKAGLLAPGRHSRLVLIGDGPLLEVPYGAILDGEGKRLVERFPVAVSVSLSVLLWPDERPNASTPLLIAADPEVPGSTPLPAAREEARAVAALVPGARVLVGAAATRRQVMAELSRSAILHFATHGLLDEEDGLCSGLLLAPEKGEDEVFLEAAELVNMQLAARLAVLSACDTGQGQKSGGEGLLGLTWAFRAAGCPSVVASLWSVDDAATGRLMAAFYGALKEGKRKDEALREAMLAVKQTKPAPYFWAAFQVNGNTNALAF
ncbi:MAG: CHAT domain-containing protein [Armatimonadota bacterium]